MKTSDKEVAPQELALPEAWPTHLRRIVDTNIVRGSLPEVTETQDERPCACYSGWVFITYEDEHGEEREASYPCRRCEAS
jgi:hypothetical protein